MSKTLIKAFVRAAVLQAQAVGGSATPKSILETLVLGRFTTEVTDGKTIVATTIGEQSVTFHVPNDLTPTQILELAEAALQVIEAETDPENPTLTRRRVKHLKVRFL